MSYALIVIKKPDVSHPDRLQEWNGIKDVLSLSKALNESYPNHHDPRTLSEETHLIDLHADIAVFVGLLSFAQGRGLDYQVLFLDEDERDWVHPDTSQVERYRKIIEGFR